VIQDPNLPVPAALPAHHQRLLDKRFYEGNYLYVVLPQGAAKPQADLLMEQVVSTDLTISAIGPAPHHRGHKPQWEVTFLAKDPERAPPHRGATPSTGERIHLWLEGTGLPADMGLQGSELLPALRAYIHDSEWSIGLHCDTRDDPSWNTRLMMRIIRCIFPEHDPLVIERATGRLLLDVWREAAEVKPPPLRDCYTIRRLVRDGRVWLRTCGLPRWGCFEIELIGIPEGQADEAEQLLAAVADAVVPMASLPPPWRAMYFSNGAGFAWVPLEHVQTHFHPDLPGMMRSDRRTLRHATVTIVSPYFDADLFTRITQQPPPPTEMAQPNIQAISTTAQETSKIGGSLAQGQPRPGPAPPVVALASLLLPGCGQLLLGQHSKGAAMLVIALFTCGALGLLNIISAFDAWVMAERQGRHTLRDWEFFWSKAS
jgi:hypothetical protein